MSRVPLKLRACDTDMKCVRERRLDVRMLCADLVEVRWKDESGRNCTAEAVLEDISASGACLQLEKPVPLDAVVYWRSGKKNFRGEVRYCRYVEIGYFVGLRFDPASRWSKKMFKPRHLLDLERLMADSK